MRNYNIFVVTFMITHSSMAFEDLLASSIAPQVMPPWATMAPNPFAPFGIWENNSRPPGISLESKIENLQLENIH